MPKAPKKPMTKAEIVEAVAKEAGTTKVTVETIYNALVTVTGKCAKKGPFTLPGLGKFTVVTRSARTGRNPRTGEEMKIPAKKAVKFTLSKNIKDKILD